MEVTKRGIIFSKDLQFCYWDDEVSDILTSKKCEGQTIWKFMNLMRFIGVFGVAVLLIGFSVNSKLVIDIGILGSLAFAIYSVVGFIFASGKFNYFNNIFSKTSAVWIIFPGGLIIRYLLGKEIRKYDWKLKK